MEKVLRLYQLPAEEKILRAVNQDLTWPLSGEVKKLIVEMKLTVRKTPGIGLAAPQVGKNLNLAVINLEHLGLPMFTIINPRVTSKSIKKTILEEGCLSIPGQFGMVKRPARVEVEAYNEAGKRIVIKGEKLLAKVLQHEIDHLNGILIIDKADLRPK